MIKIGMIGINQGNGHPYSFSAIINGYDKKYFNQKEWNVIFQYLEKCHQEDFLNQSDVKITHIFTQDLQESKKIAQSCNIPHIATSLEELSNNTDAVILAMDEWSTHLKMTKKILEQKKHVFIDKPLTLKSEEMDFFIPYLKKGWLMSCSGMMFARELDEIRKKVRNNEEKITFIEGSIGYQWDKYLIHIIDAILGILPFNVKKTKVLCLNSNFITILIQTDTFVIQLNNRNGSFIQPTTLNIVTDKNRYNVILRDNFSAFRRTLGEFIRMIKDQPTQYDCKKTILGMKILQTIQEEIQKNA